MEVYFDNSATTRVLDSVRDVVVKVMTEDYGNPSAKHRKGMAAEQYVRQAAADIAGTLKVKSGRSFLPPEGRSQTIWPL